MIWVYISGFVTALKVTVFVVILVRMFFYIRTEYGEIRALRHGIFHLCRPLDQITINWRKVNKDGRSVVLKNSRYVRKSDGRRLEIKEPTYEADNGIFQCVVQEGLNTQDTRNVELEVFSKGFCSFFVFAFIPFRPVLHFFIP